ncbi:glycosyltransferase family 4 protein [Streptococcus uberis]|uniref:glycosyltransferase family 4 protein n=1 Tax=Streptococcus uberis TaxID=1349 RepID=UPI0021F174A5|nr:glycosyltransferase family 4 protein [Streptococcus uberis]MCV6815191.1 glycosyltransferase family 4 protein [Streptococcus uberis]MCZ8476188.1 glycosyltransferase family 4 protein [Streptococcus uberis]
MSEEKHILVISQYFYPEQFRINDICNSWVERGYKVTVITGIPNYPEGKFYKGYSFFRNTKEIWNGVDIVRIPIIPRGNSSVQLMLNYISFVISGFFWSKFSKLKPDLVFTFEVSPMTQALLGSWFSKRSKIPNFLYVQDLWPENLEIVAGVKNKFIIKIINNMVDYIYSSATEIFTTSQSFVESIVSRDKNVPRKKVHFWPQYAEKFYVPKEKKTNPNLFKIAFTGNIGYAQGLDILPDLAVKLNTDRYQFVIVGEGRYKKQLQKEIKVKQVESNFIFVPKQKPEKIPDILAECDIAYLSFSNNELFNKTIPAKLQSYMACGMPVIASAKGEVENIINSSNCGICVGNGDVENLVKAIRQLEKEDLKILGENSKQYYESNFEKTNLLNLMDSYIDRYI